MDNYLSEHFTLEEMTASPTARRLKIDNIPSVVEKRNLKVLCSQVLEPARKEWKRPMRINSGYRCIKLNRAVGGKPNSYHINGRAADIYAANAEDAKQLAEILNKQALTDVTLCEMSKNSCWIHVQWSPNPRHIINYNYKV